MACFNEPSIQNSQLEVPTITPGQGGGASTTLTPSGTVMEEVWKLFSFLVRSTMEIAVSKRLLKTIDPWAWVLPDWLLAASLVACGKKKKKKRRLAACEARQGSIDGV